MAEGATGEFTSLMMEILVAAKFVSLQVNNAGLGENILGLTGRVNIQGEEVQKLDEYANEIFTKLLGNSKLICAITSEEYDKPVIIPPDQAGKYVFTMDPLDGSSNIDVNVSIGTIFSIYRKQSPGKEVTDDDLLQKGSQQVASGYIVYGSSTMFVYTSGEGVHGFTLDPSLGEFFLSHGDIRIPESGSTYSINEGNIETWEEPPEKSRRLHERKRQRNPEALQVEIYWFTRFGFSPHSPQRRNFHVPGRPGKPQRKITLCLRGGASGIYRGTRRRQSDGWANPHSGYPTFGNPSKDPPLHWKHPRGGSGCPIPQKIISNSNFNQSRL